MAQNYRNTDPETSRQAPDVSVRNSTRAMVRKALKAAGRHGITDEALIAIVQAMPGGSHLAESNIRTRRAELVDAGIVEQHPTLEGRSQSGRKMKHWRLVK